MTRGPAPLAAPQATGIGDLLPDVSFVDLCGEAGSLGVLLQGKRALVVVFTSLGCPVNKAYAPHLEALATALALRQVGFLAVDPALQDDPSAIRAHAKRQGWSFRCTRDPNFAISDALSAKTSAEVFLIGAEGRLLYRGALDDQYGINYRLSAPRKRYLHLALQAYLSARPLDIPATEAPGCLLSRVRLPSSPEESP